MATASKNTPGTTDLPLVPQTFGGRLLVAAKLAGAPVAQQKLSAWLKKNHNIAVSAAMISKYTTKDICPRMRLCRDFAVALGVRVEWLYSGRGDMRPMDPLDPEERELIELLRQVPSAEGRTDLIGHIRVYLANLKAAQDDKARVHAA